MKVRFEIDNRLMAKLKREAVRQGRTTSDLVETALRLLLRSRPKRGALPELPIFHGGRELVDIADRSALYWAMERE
jgi:hypothetical protein